MTHPPLQLLRWGWALVAVHGPAADLLEQFLRHSGLGHWKMTQRPWAHDLGADLDPGMAADRHRK